MNAFLTYMLKVAILSAVFIVMYHLLLRRETYHRMNRIILVSSLALSYILPFIVITVHKEGYPARKAETINHKMVEEPDTQPYRQVITSGSVYSSAPDEEVVAINHTQNLSQVIEVSSQDYNHHTGVEPRKPIRIDWWKVLAAVYLTGLVCVLLYRFLCTVKVIGIIKKGDVVEKNQDFTIVQTPQSVHPFSWMRYIVLPKKGKAVGQTSILDHEKAHLAHHHSMELLWTDILSAFQWFNPAMLLFRRDLYSIHEFQADADVLSKGYDRMQYQYLLLGCATDKTGFRAANTFRKSTLEGRIDMINRKRSARSSMLKLIYIPVLLMLSLGAFADTVYDKGLDETFEVDNYVRIDGLWYKFKGQQVRVVSRKTDHPYPADIIIPDTIIYKNVKYPVTSISRPAFMGAEEIESLTIPSTIKEIERSSFRACTGLKKIFIPSSVTTIGDQAFEKCTSLESIYIPASVRKMGRNCFLDCNLASINVDPANRFYDSRDNCNAIIETRTNTMLTASRLTVIPPSVKIIGDYAFSGIKGMKSVDIPETVGQTGWRCFEKSGIRNIRINSNLAYSDHTFDGSDSLETVEYGPNVTEISIPQDCPNLKKIFIPATVTKIDFGILNRHPNIESITVDKGNPVYDSRDNCNAVIETASGNLVFGCRNTTIPNTVKKISGNAFLGCSFDVFYIPASVVEINTNALPDKQTTGSVVVDPANPVYDSREGCNAIILTASNTLIYGCGPAFIPETVTSIDTYAFQGNTYLKEVTIPDAVTSMGHSAFRDCSNLERVHFGAGISEITPSRFLNSNKLSWITVSPANRKYDSRNDCNSVIETGTGILVLGGNKSTVPDGVTAIGAEAFRFRDELKSLTLPPSVKTIESMAFESCKNFEDINLEYVTRKGQSAFNATPFESGQWIDSYEGFLSVLLKGEEAVIRFVSEEPPAKVKIPGYITHEGKEYRVVEIYDEAFSNIPGIESVSIPGTVRRIGSRAFRGCPNLRKVYLEDGLASIDDDAFANCSSLEKIKLPSTVEHIGRTAFTRTALKSLDIPSSVTSMGRNITLDCRNLASLSVNPGNRTFDSRKKCNAIISAGTNVLLEGCRNTRIPDDVTAIGPYAFAGSTELKDITIPPSVKLIFDGAFAFCGLEKIDIPASVSLLEGNPFMGCGKVKSIIVHKDNPSYSSLSGSNAIISNGNDNKVIRHPETTGLLVSSGYNDGFSNYWERRSGTLIQGCRNTVIPASASFIGSYAFAFCEGLERIEIPESVIMVGRDAFLNCHDLKELHIPASVTYIDKSDYCRQLETITIAQGNPVYYCPDGCNAVIQKEGDILVWGCKGTLIPNTVKVIDHSAFEHVHGLKSIAIPESVERICRDAFYDCTALESVSISSSVRYLGISSPDEEPGKWDSNQNPFSYCPNLKTITVDTGNPVFDSREDCNAVIETASHTMLVGCSGTKEPESVYETDRYAYNTNKSDPWTQDYLSIASVFLDGDLSYTIYSDDPDD